MLSVSQFVLLCQENLDDHDKLNKNLSGVVLDCGLANIEYLDSGATSVILKAVDILPVEKVAALRNVVLKVPMKGNTNFNLLYYEYMHLWILANQEHLS